MSTTYFDLSAFEAKNSDRRDRADGWVQVPAAVQVWRRNAVILFVVGLLAGIVGAVLLIYGLQPWNKSTTLLVACGLGALPTYLAMRKQTSSRDAARLSRFADDNGFSFDLLKESQGYQGSNFTRGASKGRLMVLKGKVGDHRVEFGNLWCLPNGTRAPYALPGYVAIRLPDRLPHTVITSRRSLRRQVACQPAAEDEVEVGADGAFRVYAPNGAGHVVRSLFTTHTNQIWARLTRRYCIEIMGDVMFLYSRRPVSTGSRKKWDRTLSDVVDACALVDSSSIWTAMRHQSKHFLKSLPELGRVVDEARIKRITLLAFGAITIIVTVVLSLLHDW